MLDNSNARSEKVYSHELQKILDLENRHFPFVRIGYFMLTLLMLTASSMIINGK